jgi:cytochrome c peroxidase
MTGCPTGSVISQGPLLSDLEFHSVGVSTKEDDPDDADPGRWSATGERSDRFRTPPLRNVTLTAPYFHNGSARTLKEAIEQHADPLRRADQYEKSGRFVMSGEEIEAVSPILSRGLRISSVEVNQLTACFEALEDSGRENSKRIVPTAVPSGLAPPRLFDPSSP